MEAPAQEREVVSGSFERFAHDPCPLTEFHKATLAWVIAATT